MASFGKKKRTHTGTLISEGACVVIVKTEWNTQVVNELENGGCFSSNTNVAIAYSF